MNLTESPKHSFRAVKSATGLHLTIAFAELLSLHVFPSSTVSETVYVLQFKYSNVSMAQTAYVASWTSRHSLLDI